jgi:hypothetical protein
MEDPSALFEAFLSYSRTKGGLGRGMRGFFSGMLRGVSNPREGSKILFPLRPHWFCSSLLHLRSSWKTRSAKFARNVSKITHWGMHCSLGCC